ncbi:MAG: MFS transporter [Bacteroidales bacterium]|nr:MFS transporter [Bacteroidales bacterium]
MVCDTHCIRICGRLGLTDGSKEPEKVEVQLRNILPPEESSDFCHRIVLFGREICTARAPKCDVIFTIVALYVVDRWGRKSLMLFGAAGLGIIYLILGICYHFHITGFFMIVLVVAAIACYAMSLGPVTWVLLSEIFPNKVRGVAMATCTFALWTGCTTLTFSFPSLNESLGTSGTFWIYSGICLIGLIFFLRRLPETKGKSLEQIEKEL